MVRLGLVTTRIAERARDAGFDQSSSHEVGRLLSVLAAAKPDGRFLELGTGVGIGTAHLLHGMTAAASLITVEREAALSRIAQEEIPDPRIRYVVADGGDWLKEQAGAGGAYDLVFADTWPGKFEHRQDALALVAPGGLYVVDDLLPQPNWPAGHQVKVDLLTRELVTLDGWRTVRIADLTGLVICTKTAG